MALGNLVSSIKSDANGLVGNIAKAVLIFPNHTWEVKEIKLVRTKREEGLKKEVKALDVRWNLETTTDSTINQTFAQRNLEGIDSISGRKFTVQFNPSSIHVNARGGGRVPVSNFGKEGSKQGGTIQFKSLDPYITVSFTLMFDELNQADAFMEERFTLGATTLVKNVATAAVEAAGKEFTVRPQVEGFLAAIRNEYHRPMIFRWGKLMYAGILNSVSGKYTMFNTAGNPIRAEVEINMLLGGSKEENASETAGYLYYWSKRYEQIIKDNATDNGAGEASSMSTSTMKQQFSNLFNI